MTLGEKNRLRTTGDDLFECLNVDQRTDKKGNSKLDASQREHNFGKSKKNTNECYLHAFEIQGNSLLV